MGWRDSSLTGWLIWCFQDAVFFGQSRYHQGAAYSLKPQTINIIKNNKTPIQKIVSLYTPKKAGHAGVEEDGFTW